MGTYIDDSRAMKTALLFAAAMLAVLSGCASSPPVLAPAPTPVYSYSQPVVSDACRFPLTVREDCERRASAIRDPARYEAMLKRCVEVVREAREERCRRSP